MDDGHATESAGQVWFGALAWSGNWKITAERTVFEHVRVTGGINDFDSEWVLGAGEAFDTPGFVGDTAAAALADEPAAAPLSVFGCPAGQPDKTSPV